MKDRNQDAQAVWDRLLKDNYLCCTCDDYMREEKFVHALGHYHHCMLYQVARAVELSLKYCKEKEKTPPSSDGVSCSGWRGDCIAP